MKGNARVRTDSHKDNRKRVRFLPAGVVLLLLFFCLSLGGCGKPVIRIGFMADLSGRGSGVSIAARNGAILAVKEMNENGGIEGRLLELHIKDDKGQAEDALRVDQELVEEGVVLAIGHINSGPGVVGIPVLMEAGIPVISPAMSTHQLSGLKDLFFRVFPESGKQGEVIATEAWKQVKENADAAILMEENNLAYSEDLANGFQKNWEAVIGSGMWGMTTDMIGNAGRHGEGVLFPGMYDPDSTAEPWQQFLAKYRETFSAEPLFSSMTAYEAVMVAAEALTYATSMEGMDLADTLVARSPYEGLQGSIPIDAYGDSDRAYQPFILQDGQFRKVVP